MSEEEKKAIEDFKRTVELYEQKPVEKMSVNFDEFDYKIVKTVLNLIEKQDKMIDLMAEQLGGLTIFDIDKDEPLILGDTEEVKEYFRKKVENEEK